MRRMILTGFALGLGFLLTVGPAAAAEKKAKQDQLNGTVRLMNKDKSTITVRKGNVERQIVYNADTKFVLGTANNNKPSSVDELKEGWYVHCFGAFDGNKLNAKSCRFRETQGTTER
jgi:hypothetical protein